MTIFVTTFDERNVRFMSSWSIKPVSKVLFSVCYCNCLTIFLEKLAYFGYPVFLLFQKNGFEHLLVVWKMEKLFLQQCRSTYQAVVLAWASWVEYKICGLCQIFSQQWYCFLVKYHYFIGQKIVFSWTSLSQYHTCNGLEDDVIHVIG